MKMPPAIAEMLPGYTPDPSAIAAKTAQQWMGSEVADISGGLIVRGDGALVAVLKVEPANIALLSGRERAQRIQALHEALSGIPDAYQILCLPRPIDLDAYLADLDRLLADADSRRRHLLAQYVQYVRRVTASGEAMERRFYLLLPLAPAEARRKGAADDLRQRAAEVGAALSSATLEAHVLGDRGLIDLVHTFSHPSTAAFERPDFQPPLTRYVPFEEATTDAVHAP